jgi:hypothetical protein
VPNTTPSIRLMVIEVKLYVLLTSALDERKLPVCVAPVQELRYALDSSVGDPAI